MVRPCHPKQGLRLLGERLVVAVDFLQARAAAADALADEFDLADALANVSLDVSADSAHAVQGVAQIFSDAEALGLH